MFCNITNFFKSFSIRNLSYKHLFCITFGIYLNIIILKRLTFKNKNKSSQKITTTLTKLKFSQDNKKQTTTIDDESKVVNKDQNNYQDNYKSIDDSEFCQIFMITGNYNEVKLFLNFNTLTNVHESEGSLYEESLDILNIFIMLILSNCNTIIPLGIDTRKLLPLISRIDFICNSTHRDLVIEESNLNHNQINKIPFNNTWLKHTIWCFSNLSISNSANFQSLVNACEKSKYWFKYMQDFIISLNYRFKCINSKNVGFLGGLRETTNKEFLLPCFIDCNGSFWCVCAHGTLSTKNGRNISKNGFKLSINGLYGPGIYFSTQIKKCLQYVDMKGHILICLVNLGNNPYFTEIIGSCPIGFTSTIALGGYANSGQQIHNEIVIAKPEYALPLYSLTIKEIYDNEDLSELKPVLFTSNKNVSKQVEFGKFEGLINLN